MKFKCAYCDKTLALGHSRKFQLGIKFTDGFHQDIFIGKPTKQFECYCEDCEGRAYEKFKSLVAFFNKEAQK